MGPRRIMCGGRAGGFTLNSKFPPEDLLVLAEFGHNGPGQREIPQNDFKWAEMTKDGPKRPDVAYNTMWATVTSPDAREWGSLTSSGAGCTARRPI